ncbi:hypothetical protein ACIQMJ_10690 [Actinosynnema sp. NPDC091369]
MSETPITGAVVRPDGHVATASHSVHIGPKDGVAVSSTSLTPAFGPSARGDTVTIVRDGGGPAVPPGP